MNHCHLCRPAGLAGRGWSRFSKISSGFLPLLLELEALVVPRPFLTAPPLAADTAFHFSDSNAILALVFRTSSMLRHPV